MSRRRRSQPTRSRSTREVLTAVLASAAVIVTTALIVWLIRPSDSGPDVTDVTDETPTITFPDDILEPDVTVPTAEPPTDASTTTSPPTDPAADGT